MRKATHDDKQWCEFPTALRDLLAGKKVEGHCTILAPSRTFAKSHRFKQGEHGQWLYGFDVPCDSKGVVLVWAMHDDGDRAIKNAASVVGDPHGMLLAKTREMNRQFNEQIPWFRCSDGRHEDIYYYLWSLYLMYYIDVQQGG